MIFFLNTLGFVSAPLALLLLFFIVVRGVVHQNTLGKVQEKERQKKKSENVSGYVVVVVILTS